MIVCSIRFKHQIMVEKIECTLSWFTKAVKKTWFKTRKKKTTRIEHNNKVQAHKLSAGCNERE